MPAWAAWHYQSRQRKLLRRAYAAACPLIFAGWVTWVTQAGIHHSGAIAWVLLIPGWLALALPWWYAHPPAQPDPPPGDPDDAPEGDPLISRWAAEVAVNGLLPGSALSSPQDIGAGTRYVCALRKGMTLEDAAQVQRKVASVLGIGRHRLLFEHHGEHPGRADNESVISLAVLNPVTRQDSSQVWEGPTLDKATGEFQIGLYPDTPAWCRLFQVLGPAEAGKCRATHWMVCGLMGSGKSRAVDVAVAEMICSGMFVVWYSDGQGGVSGPALTDHVDWCALWHDETVLMLMAAYRVMKARQAFFQRYKWTDDYGNARTGVGFFPLAAGLPFLQIVMDEAQESLRDPRVSKLKREIQRLGPKVGIGVLEATQITSVHDTGGSSGDVGAQGNRAFAKAGGNVLMFRAGETLTGSSMLPPGVAVDPRDLPVTPPGMCYMPYRERPEVKVRTFNAEDADLYGILARAPKRSLHPVDVAAAGEDYASRRDRVRPDDDDDDLALLLGDKARTPQGRVVGAGAASGTRHLQMVYEVIRACGETKREEIPAKIADKYGEDISESSLKQCLAQLVRTGKLDQPRHGWYDIAGAEDLAEERAEMEMGEVA